jgi:hypothetical protein
VNVEHVPAIVTLLNPGRGEVAVEDAEQPVRYVEDGRIGRAVCFVSEPVA